MKNSVQSTQLADSDFETRRRWSLPYLKLHKQSACSSAVHLLTSEVITAVCVSLALISAEQCILFSHIITFKRFSEDNQMYFLNRVLKK
jgi:hypothetical protein